MKKNIKLVKNQFVIATVVRIPVQGGAPGLVTYGNNQALFAFEDSHGIVRANEGHLEFSLDDKASFLREGEQIIALVEWRRVMRWYVVTDWGHAKDYEAAEEKAAVVPKSPPPVAPPAIKSRPSEKQPRRMPRIGAAASVVENGAVILPFVPASQTSTVLGEAMDQGTKQMG